MKRSFVKDKKITLLRILWRLLNRKATFQEDVNRFDNDKFSDK